MTGELQGGMRSDAASPDAGVGQEVGLEDTVIADAVVLGVGVEPDRIFTVAREVSNIPLSPTEAIRRAQTRISSHLELTRGR